MQSVGDKDHSDALFRHGTDGGKQSLGLFFREYGGRLIQDQDLELVLAELACNLGKLFMADRHLADDHVFVDVEAHFVNGSLGTTGHFVIVEGIESVPEHL